MLCMGISLSVAHYKRAYTKSNCTFATPNLMASQNALHQTLPTDYEQLKELNQRHRNFLRRFEEFLPLSWDTLFLHKFKNSCANYSWNFSFIFAPLWSMILRFLENLKEFYANKASLWLFLVSGDFLAWGDFFSKKNVREAKHCPEFQLYHSKRAVPEFQL